MHFRPVAAKRRRDVAWAAIALATMALGPRPVPSEESATAARQPAISAASETFLLGNVTFALLHEFGHAIIRDFNVPLLGLEEESADTIAAVSLILLDRQQPAADFGEALESPRSRRTMCGEQGSNARAHRLHCGRSMTSARSALRGSHVCCMAATPSGTAGS